MRICEIIPCLYPLGGAERFVINLSNSFVNEGDEVFIISLYTKKDNPIVESLIKQNTIKLFFLEKKKGIDLKCAKKLKKLIKLIKPDVIHCHLDSILTIWLSGVFKSTKTFYTFHTLINTSVIGKKSTPKNILYKSLLKRKKIFPIAISQTIKKSICDYYGLDSSFVEVVYNGVPINHFLVSTSLRERNIDFIFIGRFIELKNTELILSCFKKILDTHPSSKLVMIGEGPLLSQCKQYSLDNNISNVEFKGFIEDVSPFITNAKCLLLPSTYEGNPIVINEAIASRSFVIATSVGGIPDVVNSKNGQLIVFDSKLEENLYTNMEAFLNNSDSVNSLLEENYEENLKMVSIDRASLEYKNVFKGRNK